MNMSLGRLLAAGKSLVGLSAGPGRYRVSKRARLPKFISPKNPFVKDEAPAQPAVMEPLPVPPAAAKPILAAALAAARADASEAKSELSHAPLNARAVKWLSAWGQKWNPLAKRLRRPGPTRAVVQQGELSLETVRVVRNDLSDADFEVLRPAAPRPVRALAAEKLEPVGAAWHRLTTKFLGVDQP